MSLHRIWPFMIVAVAAACSDQLPDPSEPRRAAHSAAAPGDGRQPPPTMDEEFERVARTEVPGFAGYYLDADGTPVLRLVDARQADAARRWARTHMADARRDVRRPGARAAGQEPRVVLAKYDFAQLRGWSDKFQNLVGRDGVRMLDVDERANVVWVGVTEESGRQAVHLAARQAGIPAGAVQVEIVPPPHFRAEYLTDRFDTLWAGIQIDIVPGYGGECTLGFNADQTGYVLFVTNSHCTQSYFAQDGGPIYQNEAVIGNEIGTEYKDRGPYTICGFSTCRYSDAAYIHHNGSRLLPREAHFRIATTEWSARGGPGTTRLTSPTLGYEQRSTPIVGKIGNASLTVGSFLEKVGRTSGSTVGYITRSCFRIDRLLCQYSTDIYSAPGDSGSPIRVNDLYGSLLGGILWGGPETDYNVTYFSPISGVERDLGAITVCTQYYTC